METCFRTSYFQIDVNKETPLQHSLKTGVKDIYVIPVRGRTGKSYNFLEPYYMSQEWSNSGSEGAYSELEGQTYTLLRPGLLTPLNRF